MASVTENDLPTFAISSAQYGHLQARNQPFLISTFIFVLWCSFFNIKHNIMENQLPTLHHELESFLIFLILAFKALEKKQCWLSHFPEFPHFL